jgi:hypothetical protein
VREGGGCACTVRSERSSLKVAGARQWLRSLFGDVRVMHVMHHTAQAQWPRCLAYVLFERACATAAVLNSEQLRGCSPGITCALLSFTNGNFEQAHTVELHTTRSVVLYVSLHANVYVRMYVSIDRPVSVHDTCGECIMVRGRER